MAVDERFFDLSRDVAVATNFVGKIDFNPHICYHKTSAYGEKCNHRPINKSVLLIDV